LFHFPLAAEGLGGEFDFVVAVGFVHLVDDTFIVDCCFENGYNSY